MKSITWDVFYQALNLSSEQKFEYLNSVYGTNYSMRDEIESLINYMELADASLLSTIFDMGEIGCYDYLATNKNHLHPAKEKYIGNWHLIHEFGVGSLSRVFHAERRKSGFDQRCALKLLSIGLNAPDIVNQFFSERQILAELKHPNIIRLIDGGITENGAPFFATELIEGVQITDYVYSKNLNTQTILNLFLQVLDAVDYAHNNSVVHLDIKPSNTIVDQHGRVVLLDFGIAQTLASGTAQEVPHSKIIAGTPLYSPPDRLLGHQATITADIWAMGTLLYELVAGHHPFYTDDIPAAKALYNICYSEPNEPRGKIEDDLWYILHKALSKSPSRRYQTAKHFKSDIQLFIAGKPVSARPTKLKYLVNKLVYRYRVPITISTIFFIGLVGILTYHSIAVKNQRALATEKAILTEQLNNFTLSLFLPESSKLSNSELLIAGDFIDIELAGNTALQNKLYYRLGMIFKKRGELILANEFLEKFTHLDPEPDKFLTKDNSNLAD